MADQLAAGRTPAQIAAEMQSFDVWDRYDYDGDGNFNEPDGYIDHFQIVHAGGDQADGDPIFGEDAIWSHRWYAFKTSAIGGPPQNKLGGTQIGTTGIWIGDYTIQPENGGRSVFYHEYGHDLGLPDDYNIISGGDNNNEHWTLMAQSRLGARNDGGIGERGGDLGAWNKLQLGWLNYQAVDANERKLLVLGPPEYNSNKPQALVVDLPAQGRPARPGRAGRRCLQFYSGTATTTRTRSPVASRVGAGAGGTDLRARWNIEDCGPDPCDYAFVEVDHGAARTPPSRAHHQRRRGQRHRRRPTAGRRPRSTCRPTPARRSACGSRYSMDPAVEGNGGDRPPASSSTTSPSPAGSPTAPRRTPAGPPTACRGSVPPSPPSTSTTTSRPTARTSRTTST